MKENNKIAIIGTGRAASIYLESFAGIRAEFDYYSTSGGGEFNGQQIHKVATLKACDYDKVVICSQFIDQIIIEVQRYNRILKNLYYFDSQSREESYINPEKLSFSEGKTLYAYYRLSQMSLAFNFACFVNFAQVYANHHGYDKIAFVVSSGRFGHVSFGELKAYSGEQQFWRISNLLPMTAQLAPSYSSFMHLDDEAEADAFLQGKNSSDIFPENAVEQGYISRLVEASYTTGSCILKSHFEDIQSLKAIAESRRYVEKALLSKCDGRKIVTLTLRETSFDESRNSNVEAWAAFCDYLYQKGFQPVVVRDTEVALDFQSDNRFPNTIVVSSAAFNIHIRAALYEMSYLNMGTDSGAIAMLYFLKSADFVFFFCNPDDARKQVLSEVKACLFPDAQKYVRLDGDLPFLGEKQNIIWKKDYFENIVDEFETFNNGSEQETNSY